MYLEQLLQTEDFGKKWFYQTNNDIKRYMHFFFADKLKLPTMFMVQPDNVTFDDLQLKVCLFLKDVLIPMKHVFYTKHVFSNIVLQDKEHYVCGKDEVS